MTIEELGAALRGIPRTSRLLIDTPEGLRDLRWLKPTYARASQDGGVSGSVQSDGAEYAIVLYPLGREP